MRPGETHDHSAGKPDVEWDDTLQIFNMFRLESNVKSISVGHQMVDFASADDRKDVWGLLHEVRDRHCCRRMSKDIFASCRSLLCHLPAVMCFVPTSSATFASARLIFFSSSVLSQSADHIVLPFSPDWRRLSSSSSVRNLPPASVFHGQRAIPIDNSRWIRDKPQIKLIINQPS